MHTPGPWRKSKDGEQFSIFNPSYFRVCTYVVYEPDAALIAAAPELLAMVERLLPYLREAAILLPEIGSVCRDVSEAEALIKRAQGDTN